MLPPGPNTPIIIGMQERKRRQLIQGNTYGVFYKGRKFFGVYKAIFDNDCIIIETFAQHPHYNEGEPFKVHLIFDRKWVFELNEVNAFVN